MKNYTKRGFFEVEVIRDMAQLYFWHRLTILYLMASSAQLIFQLLRLELARLSSQFRNMLPAQLAKSGKIQKSVKREAHLEVYMLHM